MTLKLGSIKLPMLVRPRAEVPGDATDDARGPLFIGIATVIAFFVLLGGWAVFARLDSAVIAIGQVQVEGNRKAVQHQDGGTVSEVLVKEGDTVVAGQVLLRLDSVQATALVGLLSDQYHSALALEARLKAERDGANKVTFPKELLDKAGNPDIAGTMAGQVNLFESRKRTLDGQVGVHKQRIGQLRQQERGATAQQQSQKKQLALIEDELKGVRELFEKGFYPLNKVRALERAAAQLGGQLEEYGSNAAGAQQNIAAIDLQILQLTKERLTEVNTQLNDTQEKIFGVLERLRAAEHQLEGTEIKAPVEGKVLSLRQTTVGGVIARGEMICEVVPDEAMLLVEALVKPEDIEDVQVGIVGEVRLTAYKARDVPPVPGVVSFVSPDRVERPNISYFKILVEVDAAKLAESDGAKLMAGMPAEVIIPTRERTVLSYLMAPLLQGMRQAFRDK